jgi:predicted regulator of Ras-like GTPase activity (Roadblock/LC7/MglB family)
MTPNEALDELLNLSSQIEDAAILGGSGFVLASTDTPERGEQLARVAADLLAAAADIRPTGTVSRVDVQLGEGGVFVIVEGGRTAIATTVPEPTAGLVVYDLRTALRRLDEDAQAPVPAKPKKKDKEKSGDA